MLMMAAIVFGPLLFLAAAVCGDADSLPGSSDASHPGSPAGARYVMLFALGVCFVTLLAAFGLSHRG